MSKIDLVAAGGGYFERFVQRPGEQPVKVDQHLQEREAAQETIAQKALELESRSFYRHTYEVEATVTDPAIQLEIGESKFVTIAADRPGVLKIEGTIKITRVGAGNDVGIVIQEAAP